MIKKNCHGETIKEGLKASAKDRLYRFLLADGTVRGAFIHGTRMVNEMRANFELGILETLALGHAYLGCGLMSSSLKGNDRLAMNIECSGPIKGLTVETNAFGEVRGHLKNVPIPIEKPLENFNLSPFFGAGFLHIIKYLEDSKQPYTGRIELQYGNIAEDLAHYFFKSEQTPTVFNLSIHFDKDGQVTGAGGLFLQVMPGASDETVIGLENVIKDMSSPGVLISEGRESMDILSSLFDSHGLNVLDNNRVEFFCRCNKELLAGYLAMLSIEDLSEMAINGPFPVETRCHNCNTVYQFSEKQIKAFYEKRLQ